MYFEYSIICCSCKVYKYYHLEDDVKDEGARDKGVRIYLLIVALDILKRWYIKCCLK